MQNTNTISVISNRSEKRRQRQRVHLAHKTACTASFILSVKVSELFYIYTHLVSDTTGRCGPSKNYLLANKLWQIDFSSCAMWYVRLSLPQSLAGISQRANRRYPQKLSRRNRTTSHICQEYSKTYVYIYVHASVWSISCAVMDASAPKCERFKDTRRCRRRSSRMGASEGNINENQ